MPITRLFRQNCNWLQLRWRVCVFYAYQIMPRRAKKTDNCILCCSWHRHGQWMVNHNWWCHIFNLGNRMFSVVDVVVAVASIQSPNIKYTIQWIFNNLHMLTVIIIPATAYFIRTSFDCAIRCNIYSSYILWCLCVFFHFFHFFIVICFRTVTILVW